MKDANSIRCLSGCSVAVLSLFLFAGCRTTEKSSCCTPASDKTSAQPAASTQTAPAAPAQPAAAAQPAPAAATTPPAAAALKPVPIHIKVGPSAPFTDAEGNAWVADQGFADGETIERPDLKIANTTTPAIYLSERYSMTSFSYPVPNGKYVVKLHFAETYEGIEAAGQRVFSFNVEGHDFKDFDVWVKAGGPLRAYIETVNVEVTDGKLDITFTPKEENPEINGIEILPAS